MSTDAPIPPGTNTQRYEAVLLISGPFCMPAAWGTGERARRSTQRVSSVRLARRTCPQGEFAGNRMARVGQGSNPCSRSSDTRAARMARCQRPK